MTIQGIITDLGRIPPVREMGTILKGRGHSGNHQTIYKDYVALGIEWDRTSEARARENRLREFHQPSLLACLPDCIQGKSEALPA